MNKMVKVDFVRTVVPTEIDLISDGINLDSLIDILILIKEEMRSSGFEEIMIKMLDEGELGIFTKRLETDDEYDRRIEEEKTLSFAKEYHERKQLKYLMEKYPKIVRGIINGK